jgi:hypothetical protein
MMARSRNLKPGFFKNETLSECSPLARLLFAGLWCLADRAGRLEDRPKRIRAELLPYDDGSVDDMLDELHRGGFIVRYEASGQRFIQVLNFGKHQTPHHKEPASTIPAPDLSETCPGQDQDLPKSSRADSLNLIPDSLNPEVPTSSDASASCPASPSSSPTDPKKTLFDLGVSILTKAGDSEKTSRSFLAKFARQDEAKLSEVLGYLAAHPKVEPKSYIAGAFKPEARGLVI